jgi:hypothetical protein
MGYIDMFDSDRARMLIPVPVSVEVTESRR